MFDRRRGSVTALVRGLWLAVRPVNRQQRFLWWCGTLLVGSGLVHAVVAAIDGGPWWGPVSWRKPVVFGLSLGVLLWSLGWVMRHLPARRWGWLPAGLAAGTAVIELALITMQRWRGVPSHFNPATTFDTAVWGIMSISILVLVIALVMLLLWALIRFRGSSTSRVAVLAGLLLVLASGAVGKSMAAIGEQVVDATGQVPSSIVFGAAGSAKLAHAFGIHGLQVLGLFAIGLELGRLRAGARLRTMLLAAAGYGSVFTAVTVTAYAGRPWTTPTPAMGALALAGIVTVLISAAVVLRQLPWSGDADQPDDAPDGTAHRRAAMVN